jgi:hypothetical protein
LVSDFSDFWMRKYELFGISLQPWMSIVVVAVIVALYVNRR